MRPGPPLRTVDGKSIAGTRSPRQPGDARRPRRGHHGRLVPVRTSPGCTRPPAQGRPHADARTRSPRRAPAPPAGCPDAGEASRGPCPHGACRPGPTRRRMRAREP